MSHWVNLKIHCLKKDKAQSLTELATFGSVLLLVMSFFVRYGLQYIYQQDIKMRAFRMALSDASTAPDGSSSLVVVKDKHIPDPQDTFGIGSVVSVQDQADIAWGWEETSTLPPASPNIPKMKFVINGTPHEYTTAGYAAIAKTGTSVSALNPVYCDGFYVQFPGDNIRTYYTWTYLYNGEPRVRCYITEGGPQARVLLLDGVTTEVISEVATSMDAPMKQITGILPEGLSQGDAVTGFTVLDPHVGQIDTNYFALNTDINGDGQPEVNQDNQQGLLPVDLKVTRGDTLQLEERPGSGGYYKSVDTVTSNVEVTHKIKHNTGISTFVEPYNLKVTGMDKPWQTSK